MRRMVNGALRNPLVRVALLNAAIVALIAGLGVSESNVAEAGPCDPPITNEIVCENSLPGNPASEWDMSGAGSSSIQGFATEFSVDQGQTVSFKVNTDASDYRIDIYRLGYYNGSGARKITTVQPSASLPQNQPSCLSDGSTGLIDCGNWGVSASWSVPSDAVSGIYIAKLVRESGAAGASHVPFVVRDDNGNSNLLFQTSDTTWQAYNTYGGNSLYLGNPAGRAYKVSYNRPFTTRQGVCCVGSIQSYLFSNEYPMVRWIERNGYDVSYFSGIDTDRRGGELLEHDAFLSVGHDEYWSGQQRANIEAARNAGVDLAFFSGNEMFWKTRWENSIDGSGTPYRTLVVYKETHANAKIDPSAQWTGTWRDPRFSPPSDGGRPENAVTGTIFMVNGPSRNDAIEVPAAEGKLRLWRNTSIATLPDGGVATLPTGVLGFEWDEDLDNGSRPPGLIRMSKTTLAVGTYVLDYGSTFGGGTATHRLTMYKHNSGALVFGAGTVQWAWGLDATHDTAPCCPSSAADSRMQQATVNLFADMGVQPGTLQGGLVAATASTDTTPPTSTITSPTSGATISAPTTITGTAADAGGGRVGGVEISLDDGATWHPVDGRETWSYAWDPAVIGPVVLKTRAVDDSGNLGPASAGVPVTTTVATAGFNDLTAGRELEGVYPAGQIDWGTDQWFISPPIGEFSTNSVSFTETATSANFNFVVPRRFVSVDASNAGTVASNVSISCTGLPTVNQTVAPATAMTINVLWTSGCNTVTMTSSNGWDTNFDNFVFDDAGVPADTTPPVISNVAAAPNGTKAQITWTTDENSDTQVEYGPTTAYGSMTPLNAALVTSHSATISGLTIGTTYHYRVLSRDAWGNLATSQDFTLVADCPCTLWDNSATPASTETETQPFELGVKFQSDIAGYISGLRFYKAAGNTGTHVAHLWTSTGQLLAQATFTSETATGWQQVLFPFPVPIAANTTYVASYHAPNGGFSYTRPYFTGEIASPPLRGLADLPSGGNGVFKQGAPGFPASSFQSSNYWVDPVFTTSGVDLVPPVVESHSPAANATGVSAGTNATATFSEPVTNVTFDLRDSGNNAVPATVTVNGAVATLDPTSVLAFNATYTATVSGAVDGGGNVMAPKTWSFTTGGPATSVFAPGATPALASQSDPGPLEVGMRFRTDIDGFIRGVRFYKGPTNTGTHTGNLWSNTGQLLARATFTNETATGWQEVLFSAPVAVTANTTYVVSYHAPNGGYALNQNFFTSEVENYPLRALASGFDGPNGLFRYGPTAFPDQSFAASNYWVDVVFATVAVDTLPPTVASTSPAAAAVDVSPSGNITATFSEPVVAASISMELRDAASALVPGTLTYDPATLTASLDPTAALSISTTYTARVLSAADASGNVLAAPVTWTFSTPVCPCSIWENSPVPMVESQNDTNSVEVGVRFVVEANGFITGVRFYKGALNTGTHTGHLWSSSGTLLGTAVFTNETASGWQQVNFASPIAVTAGSTYVASYHAPNGGYSVTPGFFNGTVANPPLRALSNAEGGNGVFVYPSGFPTGSFNATNYWVDVVFGVPAPDTSAPLVTASGPAANDNQVSMSANVTATFDEDIVPSSVSVELRNASNSLLSGTRTYDAATRTVTFDPSSTMPLGGTYTARIAGARDAAGNTMAPIQWSFSTPNCPCTLFSASDAPVTASGPSTQATEVGLKVRADRNGFITAIRFYKGTSNTGAHTGHVWSSTGTLLGTATFSGESASGWQQASLATRVAVTAGTTYVISYHTSVGRYAVDANGMALGRARGPMAAPASGLVAGNGAFATGPAGTFPTQSSSASNYWVDAVFSLDGTRPTITSRSPSNGATGVSRTTNITARFSEPVDPASITTSLTSSSGSVSGVLTYNAGTRTATFNPNSTLLRRTTYTVVVFGARDASGNVMQTVSWTFRTGN
jgi:hypothetical protein